MQCNLRTRTALLAAVLAAAGQAQAAGGAHVIDDSEVGDPGSCHVDTWAALQEHHQKQISLAPACTPAALPWLELGANLGHDWRGSRHESRVGPALKLSLLSPDHGRLDRAGHPAHQAMAAPEPECGLDLGQGR